MSREEDLALAQRVLETLPLIMRWISKDMRRLDSPLEPGQMRILGMLSERECSISQLAGHHFVSLPAMSRAVNPLVEHGWVERVGVPGDRRVVRLRLTPAGRDEMQKMHAAMLGAVADVLADLGAGERQRAVDGLAVLYSVFTARREANRAGTGD